MHARRHLEQEPGIYNVPEMQTPSGVAREIGKRVLLSHKDDTRKHWKSKREFDNGVDLTAFDAHGCDCFVSPGCTSSQVAEDCWHTDNARCPVQHQNRCNHEGLAPCSHVRTCLVHVAARPRPAMCSPPDAFPSFSFPESLDQHVPRQPLSGGAHFSL